MPRKTVPSPERPAPPILVVARTDARRQLEERVSLGDSLRGRPKTTVGDLEAAEDEYRQWDGYNVELLKRTFSNESEADRYAFWGMYVGHDGSFESRLRELQGDLKTKIDRLRSVLNRLDLIPDSTPIHSTQPPNKTALSRSAFVVHGHDDGVREAVCRFLEKVQIKPVVLHEQPNSGKTIIEKFETYADVPFSVVLLTPDDFGGSRLDPKTAHDRARQNVIFELGFFIGKLSRARVCAIYKPGVELPSDFSGILYVPYDPGGAWKFSLAKELKAAGIDVDLNSLV